MRGILGIAAIAFVVAPAFAAEKTCSRHGTTIDFYDTPKEAAAQALKEEKLVFILHISGHFEDPKMT
jgi:hypothetical protein